MRLAVLFAVLCSACVPTARSVSAQRSKLWVAPGSPTVFSWVSTVEHRETRVLELGKNDAEMRDHEDDDAVRTAIFAIDPATSNATRLGQLDGGGGVPIYYDAARDILWVSGDEGELTGLTRSDKPVGAPHEYHQLDVKALLPPFVLARDALGVVALHDLRREAFIPLAGIEKSEISVAGELVRFTELTNEGESIRVRQIAVDWSSGQPQRLPDIDWVTAPLPASVGTRLGTAVLRDGRRYAEVVRDATGTRLLVFDITAPAPPVQINLPTEATERPTAHLVALVDDVLVFGEPTEDDYKCWRGATVRVDQQLVVPMPEATCVVGTSDVGPHRVLRVKDAVGVAVVGADGAIVNLEIDTEKLAKGVTTAPSTRAVAQESGALEEINFSTGARRVLARGVAADRLLTVDASVARYARTADTLVTLPLGEGRESVLALGEPTLARVDRMPRDRTEFWLGAGGGATTTGNGAGFLHAEVAHWVTDHWTWVARANMRFEGGPEETDRQYVDLGGSFGYAWHRLPRLFSLFFQADVGANYSGSYVGENGPTTAAFAPSIDARVGWQGKMAGFDLSATVPSLIDWDRGVLFLLSVKIGFTENLH